MIRICVGTGPRWAMHERVLRHSIERHASEPIDLVFIDPLRFGMQNTGCTGFTNVRWSVPELCGNAGFAIYLDIDMLLLSDIADLWQYRERGRYVCMMDGSTEVMVMDCQVPMPARGELHQYNKNELAARAPLLRGIPPVWNCQDEVTPGARLLHFTDLKRQPWFTPGRHDAAVAVLREYERNAN